MGKSHHQISRSWWHIKNAVLGQKVWKNLKCLEKHANDCKLFGAKNDIRANLLSYFRHCATSNAKKIGIPLHDLHHQFHKSGLPNPKEKNPMGKSKMQWRDDEIPRKIGEDNQKIFSKHFTEHWLEFYSAKCLFFYFKWWGLMKEIDWYAFVR